MRPADFEKRFGHAYSDLGYKLKDVLIADNTKVRVILLLDDGLWGDSGVAMEYFSTQRVTEMQYHQEVGDHIREESTREHVDRLTSASKAELAEVLGRVVTPGPSTM